MTDRHTDMQRNITQISHFDDVQNESRSQGSLWCLSDANRFNFHEDMHKNYFWHFRFDWLWPLTCWAQIYFASYCCPALCLR